MKKMNDTKTIGLFFACLLSFLWACNQGGNSGNTAKALKSSDFDYLTEKYTKNPDGALENGLAKKEIFKEPTTVQFKNEDANYVFTAYQINNSDGATNALLIRFDIDRMFTPLIMSAEPQRKQETYYFCIPSSKSEKTLFDKYNEAVQKLGYKDYEVFLSSLTKLLAKVYM